MSEQLSHHEQNAPRLGDSRNVSGLFGPWKEHTVTERRAVEMFRQFEPQEIADAISTHIFEQPVISNYKTRPLDKYMQELQEPAVVKATPYEITNHIAQGRPDVYNLYQVYNHIVSQAGRVLVDAFPQRFAEILQQETLGQDRERLIQELGGGQNMIALRLAFVAAFTPQGERGSMQSFHTSLGIHDFGQVHDFTPDVLTNNITPEMRLDAFGRMLAQPRTPAFTREDHQRALITVCNQRGIDAASLQAIKESDRQLFSEIHKQAGSLLNESRVAHARKSLVGVFHNDIQEEQHGSIYTFATRAKDDPRRAAPGQVTERGMCAGSDLHDALAQGIGLALLQNRDLVLNLISNPMLQLNERQRGFYHDTSIGINGIKNKRGAYANPRMAQSTKQYSITEISKKLGERDIPPHYRSLLNELLIQAQELEV
ncbi:MAG TPA: hypothetical protein VLG12_07590 [Candidatus Saccharimonadales bacterium]|nr:hypothetical protein [Candidatus Saccharimonadales bacterium]